MHPDLKELLAVLSHDVDECEHSVKRAEERRKLAMARFDGATTMAADANVTIELLVAERDEARARIAELEEELARLRDPALAAGPEPAAEAVWHKSMYGSPPDCERVDVRAPDGKVYRNVRTAANAWPWHKVEWRPHVEADTTAAGTAAVQPAGGSDD